MPTFEDPLRRSQPWHPPAQFTGGHNWSVAPLEYLPSASDAETEAQLLAYGCDMNFRHRDDLRDSILETAAQQDKLGPVGQACERLAPFVQRPHSRAPLTFSEQYSNVLGCAVYFKDETCLSVGSFKLRGALNAALLLSPEERARGLLTLSAGNAAQGVAKAAWLVGTSATILMPKTTPASKVAATQELGGTVILTGRNLEETRTAFEAYQREHPEPVVIHPYDNYNVAVGQGTSGYEVLAELPEATHLFVPTGGGGLLAGIHLAAAERGSHARRIGVEAEHAASFALAHRRQRRESLRSVYTKAEGSAVAQIGKVAFQVLSDDPNNLVKSHVVSEQSLHLATVELNEHIQKPIECTGALGFAALRSYGEQHAYQSDDKLVVFLTGRHRDEKSYRQMVTEYQRSRLTVAS